MRIHGSLSLGSLRAFWFEQSKVVEATFHNAATRYANHCALEGLTGEDMSIYQTEFDCAADTRNRMLAAIARNLLSEVDDSVTECKAYMQYADGLLTNVECCNALTLHAHREGK